MRSSGKRRADPVTLMLAKAWLPTLRIGAATQRTRRVRPCISPAKAARGRKVWWLGQRRSEMSPMSAGRAVYTSLRDIAPAMKSAWRIASETIVRVGFSAPPLVNWLPSAMKRFLMSCV